ncbi:cyclopropane fatty acid synthase and related methyltransferase [Methylophaga aminisulfidivorans MP]|uniref:Cyclopropane fatty acid synthase and related methyltransferase n=1 Tax=Methylophaga aminisulfidivorans MP TaxID=1026882 RepID=F5SVU4_9GAMM|nr:cyclopropane fatty acyl phospholipid synthase [Methylophaga aminisulfidivorans]EGL55665.1 cyclopropane fatty acid synthase and related methyltransferase [Methylophaga aminisulfidivorans MP]
MTRFKQYDKSDDAIVSSPSSRASLTPPAVLRDLAKQCDVRFNDNEPWDIQVHHRDVYSQILTKGSLGFGESYMDGLWDCERLDELFYRIMRANIEEHLVGVGKFALIFQSLRHRFFNLQTVKRAYQVGEQHYDIGNDVFEAMLDPTMSYSCGFWQKAHTLEQAQVDKLDMICKKLQLKPGEKLLEIGCGWGGLARHAAKNYGVEVLGITISQEQQKLAQQRCQGLPVEIRLTDYRDLDGQFDKIVSVGMFEHVGEKNYPIYFDTVNRLLKDDGLFLLHTIGIYKTIHRVDPWIDKYIFRNGKLPSAEQIAGVLNKRMVIEDWHNFGQDYALTLLAWWDRFEEAWPELSQKYSQRFYRMWKYYLMSCAGFFKSRQGQLWQIVLTKRDRLETYRSIR